MARGFRTRALRVLLISAALLVGAVGVAYATSAVRGNTPTATIQACEGIGGLLRIVQSPSDCRHHEVAISWNVVGPAGPAGPQGPAGPKGATGATGAAGATGPAGPAGTDGAPGAQGPAGPKGDKGDTGAAGAAGAPGPAGPKGDKGDTGAAGAAGPAGADGAAGPAGPKGDTGPQGPIGPVGPSGADPAAEAFIGHFGSNTNNGAAANGETCTLGEILLSASPSVTVGGVPANGQLLPINQNQALFALLGTTYGGNGQTTFALPDLRGLAPNNMTYSICDEGVFPSRR
jgi:Phage Tail Collar Domain/Collagen triple helix repeat (20 copies)